MKRKLRLQFIGSVIVTIVAAGVVVLWMHFWLTNCTSGNIGDLPALCLLGGK